MTRKQLKNIILECLREVYVDPEDMPGRKAGCIPFYIKDKEVYMLFMKPSDVSYGGSQFQIAKGGAEPNNLQNDALREAKEELGLKKENVVRVIHCGKFVLKGMFKSYGLEMFAAEVNDPDNFDKPHYETSETKWMTLNEFLEEGRFSQQEIVKKCHSKMT